MKPKILVQYDSTLKCWKATLAAKKIGIDSAMILPNSQYFEIGATRHEALGKLVENYSGELGIEVWVK